MPATYQSRLSQLRETLRNQKLDGFVVPICDEHMSEYVGDYAQRLAWLTGFTGSAGSAAILADKAALFVDGRYTTQAAEQVPDAEYEKLAAPEHSTTRYLSTHVTQGQRIGFDPWLHGQPWVEQTRSLLAKKGAELIAIEQNPIDTIWESQPDRPAESITDHAIAYTGKDRAEKLAECATAISRAGADLGVICALDGIAWTLNLRGQDIDHCPVAYSFLIIPARAKPQLCIQLEALSANLRSALETVVTLHPYDACLDVLSAAVQEGMTVMLDPQTAVASLFNAVALSGGQVLRQREPCTLPKACKNQAEQEGTRTAHKRDGAALTRFLAWFDSEAPKGELTEMSAADRLASERARVEHFQGLSFRTISAAAHHAALPHYSVTPQSNIAVPTDGLYLVDSGGQYLDGTTDVTRTIQVGNISEEAKKRYTQVLKGHIAVATARFPAGTPGRAIDTLARMALWADGADFDHGTGHGVGSYLNVHEGPQRIAKAGADEPLKPGMICSNEPGYYREGDFGIRIENLVIVQPKRQENDERTMYGFETITLAPIDRKPILIDLLTPQEIAWLDAYHMRVREVLSPLVGEEILGWLRDQTAPLV